MKNRKFIFLVIILVLILICCILIFSKGNLEANRDSENSDENSCSEDLDCDDSNSCTIDYCNEEKCSNTDVVLCYQNDGCCPSGCTVENDNDC